MYMSATDERNRRFMELLEPVYNDCQRWAYSLAQDYTDAQDILAQSVMNGLSYIHQLKNDGAFKTWMFRIIHNTYKHWLRTAKRLPEAVNPEELSFRSPRADEWTENVERAETVQRLLLELAPEQREALVLFELQELSIKEIAVVLCKQETAVRVMLHRARARLRERLESAGVLPKGT
jgi:RNA polymerase sigma-70 factor, ECF subfamily